LAPWWLQFIASWLTGMLLDASFFLILRVSANELTSCPALAERWTVALDFFVPLLNDIEKVIKNTTASDDLASTFQSWVESEASGGVAVSSSSQAAYKVGIVCFSIFFEPNS